MTGRLSLCVTLWCALTACKDSALQFPEGFLWAVASSAHESEGQNVDTDWHAFEQMDRVPAAGWAQNSYQLYDVDAANAASVNLNAFQLGIEWARIVPRRPADPFGPLQPGDVDAAAVAHYHQVLHSLTSRGLTPIVAVTHFTLPKWVHNPAAYDENTRRFTDGSLGGFASEDTARALARYAEFLAKEYGDEVKWWITIDEPMVVLVAGYLSGDFPPGVSNLSLTVPEMPFDQSAVDLMGHMASCHAQAYHAIKAVRPEAQVGFAHNSVDWEPLKPAAKNQAARDRVHYAYNLAFLDALTSGDFDTGLVGSGPVVHHDEWARTLDYVGVNYYDAAWVIDVPGLLSPLEAMPCSPAVMSSVGDVAQSLGCPKQGPPEPPGMTKMLLEYQARYGLPLLITESGFIDTPEGKAGKIVEILAAVHDAIRQGAKVVGYCYWTLNYDYEWNNGWHEDMGLFTIKGIADGLPPAADGGEGAPGPDTDFTRVPLKPFTEVYGQIARENRVGAELLTRYLPDAGR